ncbi:Asp23/Gls24 family envelope stress response protein [Streptomyces sp. HNM0574]|uniref:Asp23/Gls24 family envelope stress response protein n=1 Tax=Streptomyces sp. HNM0574 TaxID=2714954 RepID=UPI00146A2E37|nr:Asp23/Gls24 family envelope stress response protein [Streptomyces sp. HNM0574]NLU69298.1 Asp23/Gls24 family envelope stress response protein [Streptomyces sp. HNM0574]
MADSNTTAGERGTTTISDTVVAKTAGIAAREVKGVHALGGTASQMMGAVRRRVGGGTDVTQGVSVEVGQTQAAVDLSIKVDYGEAIHKVAQSVRDNIIRTVERTTGLEVVEVNIQVTDVYLEGSDDEEEEESGAKQSGRSLA